MDEDMMEVLDRIDNMTDEEYIAFMERPCMLHIPSKDYLEGQDTPF